MVFVVGCLIVITVIAMWAYFRDLDNLGSQARAIRSAASSQGTQLPTTPEKNLVVVVKTRNPNYATARPPLEFRYDDLRNDFVRVKGGYGYSGPALEQIINLQTPFYRQILVYDEENNRREIEGLNNWIVAIDRNNSPIPQADGGPYLLLNTQNPIKSIGRVARIEAL